MKLKPKLVLAFLIMLIPFFIFIIINYSIQRTIHESFHKVKEISGEIQTLGYLQLAIGKVLMPGNDYIITGDRRHIKEFERASADLENQLRSAEEILTRLKAQPGSNPATLKEEEEILKSVKMAWENIKDTSLRIFAIPDPVGSRIAARLMEEMDYKWAYPAVERLGRWRELDRKEYTEAVEDADRAWRHHLIIMAASIAALTFFGISFSLLLSRLFAMPIKKLQEGVEALAGGNLDYRLNIPATGDEFEQLTRGFNVMAERLNDSTEALHESEGLFRLLSESALTGVYLIQDNLFRYVNQALASIFGYEVEEVINRLGPMDLTAPEDRALVAENIRKRMEEGIHDIHYSFRGLRKDRAVIDVEVHGARVDYKGKPAVIGTLIDITERKKAEEALAFLANITEHATDAIVGLDLDSNIVSWNRGAEMLFGYPAEEIIGRPWSIVVPEEGRMECRERFKKATLEGFTKTAETLRVAKDSRRFPAEMTLTSLMNEKGEHIGFVTITRDITERKKAEETLRGSEERYKRLVESVTNYIYTVKIDNGRAAATSHGPGCVAVTGYTPEEYGADPYLWHRMVYEEDRGAVMEQANRVLSGEAVPPLEHRIIHKDGKVRWVRNTPVPHYDEQGRLIAYDGLIKDITEIKRLGEQLQQAQKMEAVGQLAGGIAHDFNNILNVIIGYGNLMEQNMREDDPNSANLNEIIKAGERATHLTRGLLAYSRKQIIDLRPVNLNEIIKDVEKFLRRIIGEDIELKTILNPSLPPFDPSVSPLGKGGIERGVGDLTVLADRGQIEQILMNLATNARDAMPDGGELIIETGIAQMDEEYVKRHGYGEPGMYALISITDTGIGIDEKTRERIFDPFFTTKEMGRGTGLGLSIVYGIIKQHDGFINVYSESGRGTTFKIYLPLIKSEAEETGVIQKVATYPAGGTETVLIAEDDEAVRKLTRDILERFGYKVIAAEDGEDAVEKFMDNNKEDIQLLLLDVIMPKKNGKEVYEEIKKINPGIKTLFLSGYTANLIHKKGILEKGLDFILKPVSAKELLRKVREILDLPPLIPPLTKGRNKGG